MLSFYADHYMRTYVRVRDGGGEADATLEKIGFIDYDRESGVRTVSYQRTSPRSIGPLWLGTLHDQELLAAMSAGEHIQTRTRCAKYLELWRNELDVPFYYENDEIASMLKVSPQRLDVVLGALGASGKVSKTHFSPTGIRTDLPLRDLLDIYRGAAEKADNT
jgi:tRNA (guanine26-N2/guanine27-N2)-dimethyltransferase